MASKDPARQRQVQAQPRSEAEDGETNTFLFFREEWRPWAPGEESFRSQPLPLPSGRTDSHREAAAPGFDEEGKRCLEGPQQMGPPEAQ